MSVRWQALTEHLLLFVLLVTIISVVYNGLRRENVAEILRVGLARSAFFVVVSLVVFGLGGFLLAEWL